MLDAVKDRFQEVRDARGGVRVAGPQLDTEPVASVQHRNQGMEAAHSVVAVPLGAWLVPVRRDGERVDVDRCAALVETAALVAATDRTVEQALVHPGQVARDRQRADQPRHRWLRRQRGVAEWREAGAVADRQPQRRIAAEQVSVPLVPIAERDHLQPRPQQLGHPVSGQQGVARVVQVAGDLLRDADRVVDGAQQHGAGVAAQLLARSAMRTDPLKSNRTRVFLHPLASLR
jgi:hypothetical protein